MKELPFLGTLAAEIFFKQSDAWYDFVRNFMVSIVVLVNSFYCTSTQKNLEFLTRVGTSTQ